MDDSINTGERSDRLVVRWDLDREPGPRAALRDAPAITIPRDHERLRTADPQAAHAVRDEVAGRIEALMAQGMVIAAFDPAAAAYAFALPDEVPA
jgi:predicted GNAT superfamily acetyltransferase